MNYLATIQKQTGAMLAAAAACLCLLGAHGFAAEKAPPNVVLIMSDDMGFSDLGCFGGEIQTPNLDGLAENGLRFVNFYSENMCVPSRSAMLTGLYTNTARRDGKINTRCPTIAEALSAHGYATRMAGKWHQGGSEEDLAPLPVGRGFQHFFGTTLGAGSFFTPFSLMRDNQDAEDEFADPDFYYTDAISDNAVEYIAEIDSDQPLLLYVAYTAAHWPLHARPRDIAKYEGRYSEGWDHLRDERLRRMKELGIVPPHSELSPRNPNVPSWEDEENKKWQERRMEVYAAQIDSMDQGIGRIVEALRRTGRFDNTLLMYMIDNGGCHVEYEPDRKGAFLPEESRDGRVMVPGNLPGVMPGPEDTFQSYGHGWANASNTPNRLFKKYAHEGGIRTPLIVHWPGGVMSPGTITTQVAHLIDIMPTVLDATGAEHPKTLRGKTTLEMDGKTLLPVFAGVEREGHRALFWEWSQGKAVRSGQWKLVRAGKGPWELYDIESDPAELNDLAGKHPERTRELSERWEEWSRKTKE